MNAFDMISEPIFFAEQLREHSDRVHQGVELIPLLTDALLAEDAEKMKDLRGQISGAREALNQTKLSLYEQIRNMHFHSVDGNALSQYLTCQERVVSSAQELADLLVLRKTTIPAELRADFRALVDQVVNVSKRTRSLTEGLFSEEQTVGVDWETQDTLDVIQGVHSDHDQAKRLEMEFARHLYSLEKQLDPVTLLFLDKCRTGLCEMAGNAAQTADQLRLMIRQA